MSEYMENSAMATGLENVSFHSNPKEKQCQRTFKLAYNAVHTAARLFSKYFKLGFSKASAVCELRTCRCTFWILKRQRNQRSNCQHMLDHRKSKETSKKRKKKERKKEKSSFCFINYDKAFDCVDHKKSFENS